MGHISNAINEKNFNLFSTAFSATTDINEDYTLDSIELNFTTRAKKTIVLTSSDGNIFEQINNSKATSIIRKFRRVLNNGDNITVDITQTSSACLLDCLLRIESNRIEELFDTPETFKDTNFVSADSPANLDVNVALGRNATQFSVQNDGGGDFTVAVSNDGISFGGEHTMQNGETYAISDISVDTIRITHIADSAYRVVVL